MPELDPLDVEAFDIDPVVVEPDYCPRCGTAVGTCHLEGREYPWCAACELVLAPHPAVGVHVVVHDGERVLVLDEPIPQHEGLLSLPGGHARPDEGPREAVVRELEEEAGLHADPTDLRYLTTLHAEYPGLGLYLLTYALDREATAGELRPEAEGFEVAFRRVASLSPDDIRESDLERIELAIDGTG